MLEAVVAVVTHQLQRRLVLEVLVVAVTVVERLRLLDLMGL
jgi:hypothetical protein